jgi:hypothetical protein
MPPGSSGQSIARQDGRHGGANCSKCGLNEELTVSNKGPEDIRWVSSAMNSNRLGGLAELGATLANLVGTFEINPAIHFAATRRHIRDFYMSVPDGVELNELVFELLS